MTDTKVDFAQVIINDFMRASQIRGEFGEESAEYEGASEEAFETAAACGWDSEDDNEWPEISFKATQREILNLGLQRALAKCNPPEERRAALVARLAQQIGVLAAEKIIAPVDDETGRPMKNTLVSGLLQVDVPILLNQYHLLQLVSWLRAKELGHGYVWTPDSPAPAPVEKIKQKTYDLLRDLLQRGIDDGTIGRLMVKWFVGHQFEQECEIIDDACDPVQEIWPGVTRD